MGWLLSPMMILFCSIWYEIVTHSLGLQGDVLSEQAKCADTEQEMDKIFEIARSKYALSSVDPITLNNWGFVYYEHAILKTGSEKSLLLDQAEEKYKGKMITFELMLCLASLVLESTYYTSIANIGNVQRERAKLECNTIHRMEAYFQEAIELYKKSLRINPSHYKGYVYWSQCLLEYSQVNIFILLFLFFTLKRCSNLMDVRIQIEFTQCYWKLKRSVNKH
jgi:tetratricopeptide (TPR) repeat protein